MHDVYIDLRNATGNKATTFTKQASRSLLANVTILHLQQIKSILCLAWTISILVPCVCCWSWSCCLPAWTGSCGSYISSSYHTRTWTLQRSCTAMWWWKTQLSWNWWKIKMVEMAKWQNDMTGMCPWRAPDVRGKCCSAHRGHDSIQTPDGENEDLSTIIYWHIEHR